MIIIVSANPSPVREIKDQRCERWFSFKTIKKNFSTIKIKLMWLTGSNNTLQQTSVIHYYCLLEIIISVNSLNIIINQSLKGYYGHFKGYSWLSMVIHDYSGLFMVNQGYSWVLSHPTIPLRYVRRPVS